MDFQVLGPMAVLRAGHRVDLGSRRRERCLLGLLLLEAGRAISIDRLVDLLWEGEPPANARGTLSSHVSRLRGLLDPNRDGGDGFQLRTRGDGYIADVPPGDVDAHRFRALTESAAGLADPADRSRVLGEALGLWRGPLLADVASDWLRDRVGADLVELRLATVEAKLDADLACGRHSEAVVEMAGVVAGNPFRERLASLFMLALYRSGRQTDALAVYHTVRDRLAEELGIDPGSDLRSMHEAILRRDPGLELTSAGPVAASAGRAQLPAPPRHFTGRAAELAGLKAILDAERDEHCPVIATIVGPAGVGKTALALRWATAVRDRFPDGQLYVNLRGFSVDPPTPPIEALGQLLRALGVAAERIPADVDEAAAAYRGQLSDRRMLVLLDNAFGVDQVRPLLPGGSASAVVVTSRNRLGGLTAVEGAHRVTLAPLPIVEAGDLLRAVLGPARVDAEPVAAAELAEACGRLPLALRVAAANVGDESAVAIRDHVSELRRGRLNALAVDDDSQATVRVALDLSYLRLAPEAQRLFRRMSLAPGADVGVHGAGALLGVAPAQAHRIVGSLADAHLVDESPLARYTMHDLVGFYAAERMESDEPAAGRAEAADRMMDWYLAVAEVVCRLGMPRRHRPPLTPRTPPHDDLVPAEMESALALLDGERSRLAAVTKAALDRGEYRSAWTFAYLLGVYYQVRGDGLDGLAVYQHGLEAAERIGDEFGAAAMHNSLGITHGTLRRWAEATDHLRQAERYYQQTGDADGESRVLINLGRVLSERRQFGDAERAYERSLRLSTTIGDRRRVAHAWNNLAMTYLAAGRTEQAVEAAEWSLQKFRDQDDRYGEGLASDTLGRIHTSSGEFDAALKHFQQALLSFRDRGHREAEGETLANIGATYLRLGDIPAAIEHLESAARRHHSVADPHEEAVARRLLAEAHLAEGDRKAALSELDAAGELRKLAPDATEEAALRRVMATVTGR
ncbi:AfsR/SARP family transcriptional regulator [Paractinoplanes atraurantiacus]|uniref:DNA-binding transcriptional activator of the SARP family n=1 Tax=Paractinoplanes atraurantiacus TaxID=1036182 RepID=A0A285ILU5_9ACTN|nr:tetratricopeptide repeat protein [Actinoplanes atraurantiacus]SNY48076.1 DNA-binding transcriptional activator of the SARP family [Actinoplanes atraurantiacus]